jgi:O-antigen biosynthesis protein WbqP
LNKELGNRNLKSEMRAKRIYFTLKRAVDLVLSIIGVIVLFPVLFIIAIVIKLDSKGPILFRQKRVGKNKSYFQILKFRTMKVEAPDDAPTHLLTNPEHHITKVGRVLRKTSLDELPQLFNIIKGEMTIVGPRPALWNQYDLIEERDKYGVNHVTPGITGFAQINGRDELDIEDKARLDGEYVDSMSIWVDIQCLFKTVFKVLKSDGVVEGEIQKTNEENIDNGNK